MAQSRCGPGTKAGVARREVPAKGAAERRRRDRPVTVRRSSTHSSSGSELVGVGLAHPANSSDLGFRDLARR